MMIYTDEIVRTMRIPTGPISTSKYISSRLKTRATIPNSRIASISVTRNFWYVGSFSNCETSAKYVTTAEESIVASV